MVTGSRISLFGWAMTLIVLAGCDSSRPADGTTRLSVSSTGATSVKEPFENVDAWETVAGAWMAEKRGAQTVLKQTATDETYPVTLLRILRLSDVEVSVEFRPMSGRIDATGGIVFRAVDGSNYYVVRANSLEDNFRLYSVIDGRRSQIASIKVVPPALGKRHSLRVVAVGDRIQAYLNNALLIDHQDRTFASGRVGLWTKADAVTEFSSFEVIGVTANGEGDERIAISANTN